MSMNEYTINVFLDGQFLKKPYQVIKQLTDELCIPYSSGDWEQLHDWLCDLDWLPYRAIVIHFLNVNLLLNKYPRELESFWTVMNSFKDFWNETPENENDAKFVTFVFHE